MALALLLITSVLGAAALLAVALATGAFAQYNDRGRCYDCTAPRFEHRYGTWRYDSPGYRPTYPYARPRGLDLEREYERERRRNLSDPGLRPYYR